jgi:MarR family transcriptional regulator, transcriptional regulator for hemolysin
MRYYSCMSNKRDAAPIRLEDGFAYRIYRCSRRLRMHFRAVAEQAGVDLSQEQWFILSRLVHEDGLAQGALGDAVLDDRPNLARHLASLEARKLVRREADALDGRKYCVRLTAEGRRLHDRFAATVPQARVQLTRGLTKDDLATAIRVLSRLEDNIQGL